MTLKLYLIQLSQLPSSLLIALLCASWTMLLFHSFFVHNPREAGVCCLMKSDPSRLGSDFPLVKVEYIPTYSWLFICALFMLLLLIQHMYFVLSLLFLYLSRISGVQTIVYSSCHFNFEHNTVYLVAFNKFVFNQGAFL